MRPKESAIWTGRGEYRALRSQWNQAANDYWLRGNPTESITDETFQYAGLMLLSGDEQGYRRLCGELTARESEAARKVYRVYYGPPLRDFTEQ